METGTASRLKGEEAPGARRMAMSGKPHIHSQLAKLAFIGE